MSNPCQRGTLHSCRFGSRFGRHRSAIRPDEHFHRFFYSANVSGSNLRPDTFFDVRFISPGSNESAVALNWQRGLAQRHDLPAGIAAGAWTINGVRAHQDETDHTGDFIPISATITVVQPLR
jgi:hypothetical protein